MDGWMEHARARTTCVCTRGWMDVWMDPLVDTKHNWLSVYDITAVLPIILDSSFSCSGYGNKFCYKDWVVEKFGKDRDGNRKKVR